MAANESRDTHDFSLIEPHSAAQGNATPENIQTDAKTVGKASGGTLGAATGMALGAAGGPVGLLLGGIAGAVGGWWAGRGVANAITDDDDAVYRAHYEATPDRPADRTYDSIRPAYVAGHLAGRNPEYAGRTFEDVEGDLQCGWSDEIAAPCGEWAAARRFARAGFERSRGIGR